MRCLVGNLLICICSDCEYSDYCCISLDFFVVDKWKSVVSVSFEAMCAVIYKDCKGWETGEYERNLLTVCITWKDIYWKDKSVRVHRLFWWKGRTRNRHATMTPRLWWARRSYSFRWGWATHCKSELAEITIEGWENTTCLCKGANRNTIIIIGSHVQCLLRQDAAKYSNQPWENAIWEMKTDLMALVIWK